MSNHTIPQKAATESGVINLGSFAKRIHEVTITSPEEVQGRTGDSRKFRLVETDGQGNVLAVYSTLRLGFGTDLPIGTPVQMPAIPEYVPNTFNRFKLTTEPIGDGLAHPELAVVVSVEE